MQVPGLRSPHEKVAGICYVPRMLDKIRLHCAGNLPSEYHANLGIGFDARATSFLKVDYPAVVARVKAGGGDDEIMEWIFETGRKPSNEDVEVWNEFMRKRGWNDEGAETLRRRLKEAGLGEESGIHTFFDIIDADEGRERHRPFE